MKLKHSYFNQLAHIALKNQMNFIPVPVDPQPLHHFERIHMFEGSAAFWINSAYCEIRNCPWAKPGSLLRMGYSKLKIYDIEVKPFLKSFCLFSSSLRESQSIHSDLRFMSQWDKLFEGSEYASDKNPLTWILYFEYDTVPMLHELTKGDCNQNTAMQPHDNKENALHKPQLVSFAKVA